MKIAAGDGFAMVSGDPNGFWPPGYSYYLSFFMPWFGSDYAAVFWPNLLAALAGILATGRLAGAIFGPRAAVAAAWMVACYPTFILQTTIAMAENLYLPLLAVFSLGAWHVVAAGARWRTWGLLGLLLGAMLLVRPTAMLLPGLVVVAGMVRRQSLLRTLAATGMVAVVGVAACVPWGLRQRAVFGEFTLSAFNGGPVLWFGNHDGEPSMAIPERFASLDIVARHHAMKAEAVAFIKANPQVFLARSWSRTVLAVQSETIGIVWNEPAILAAFGEAAVRAGKVVTSLGWYSLVVGFGLSLLVRWRRGQLRAADLYLAAGMVCAAVPFVVFDSQNRYHLPMVPYMITAVSALLLPRLPQNGTVT